MHPKIKDIALLAGVSTATVSLALRQSARVRPDTRKRVEDAARQLDYKPNVWASQLAHCRGGHGLRTNFACLLGHRDSDPLPRQPVYRRLLDGVRARCKTSGLGLDVLWALDPRISPHRLNQILRSRGIQAVLLLALNADDLPLPWENYSSVYLWHHPVPPHFHYVWVDQFRTTRMALEQLAAAGHRRIGLAIWKTYDDHSRGRIQASYLLWQQQLPARLRLPPLLYPDLDDPGAWRAWHRRHRPDAIVTIAGQVPHWTRKEAGTTPTAPPCIDLDWQDGSGAATGFERPYEMIGSSAVDQLVALWFHGERGFVTHQRGTLIRPVLRGPSVIPSTHAS